MEEGNESWDEDDEDTEGVPIATKKRILEIADAHPKWSLTTLQRLGCAALSQKSQLGVWRKQVESGGTHWEKMKEVRKCVLENFLEARDQCKIIKTVNIQQWAIQKATAIGLHNFKASESWATAFKSKHRISSRKVTHLVNRHEVTNMDQILKKAEQFKKQVKSRMPEYKPHLIINTDQCGFNYELVSGRTLTQKGVKKVFGYAKSPKNLVTHSYTVQFTISAAGTIVGNVFVCLQETSGRLGPKVEEKLLKTPIPNVTFTCSRSGKLNTSLVKYFNEQIFRNEMDEDFLYILDSWSGQTNPDIYESIFGPENNAAKAEVHIIPEKCTPYCQPLDTTFHRQLKILARRIINHMDIFIEPLGINPEDRITYRLGILKLVSLLHHQLSAPIFNAMIRYSFYSSGLIEAEDKEEFANVLQVCFEWNEDDDPNCSKCKKEMRFIKCSRCREILCFSCFFFDFHTMHCAAGFYN